MPTATRLRPLHAMLAPLRWLERSRGWRRRLLIVAYLIVGSVVGFFVWWATSLNYLPDVGDPFDVEAFRASARVPEDRDAFVLYRKAIAWMGTSDPGLLIAGSRVGWSAAKPNSKKALEATREALAVWREGTDRPDALPEPIAPDQAREPAQAVIYLCHAALFEGSRLQDEGDYAAALDWYLAVARSCQHMRMHSRVQWREMANGVERLLTQRMAAWVVDAKTDPAQLRRAVAALRVLNASTPPISDTLKAEYLLQARHLSDPPKYFRGVLEIAGSPIEYDAAKGAHHAYWFLKREPDRSLRVTRLLYANWLAHCDKPPARRPAMVGNTPVSPLWSVYAPDPSAPEAARAIEPSRLSAWIESTVLARRVTPFYPTYVSDAFAEQGARSRLIVALAEELYRRENGKEPPSVAALVPKYLDRVPEEFQELDEEVKPSP